MTTGTLAGNAPKALQALCRECHDAVDASTGARSAGCLRTLVWIVVISLAVQLAAALLPMLLRHFGLI